MVVVNEATKKNLRAANAKKAIKPGGELHDEWKEVEAIITERKSIWKSQIVGRDKIHTRRLRQAALRGAVVYGHVGVDWATDDNNDERHYWYISP